MSGRIPWALVLLFLLPRFAFAQEWQVQADGHELPLRFSGKVNIDRRQVIQYLPPATKLLVEWSVDKGDRVRRGDLMQRYASNVFIYEIPDEELEMEEARRQFASRVLDFEAKLRALSDEKAAQLNELEVAKTKLARQENTDPEALKLLEQRAAAAAADAAENEVEFSNIEELFRLGQITRNERDAALLKRHRKRQRAEASRRSWRIAAEERDEESIVSSRLNIQKLEHGIGLHGGGLIARIAAIEESIAAARKQYHVKVEEEVEEYQATLRHSYDHTPLCWLEVETPNETFKINFGAAESADSPWRVDQGKAWNETRAYGWDSDLGDAIITRKGKGEDSSLILLRGERTWRLRTGPGSIKLRVRVGDTVEWQGAFVRHGDDVLFVKNVLKPKRYETTEHSIELAEDILTLTFGSTHLKTLRAERDGIVSRDPWASPIGSKIYSIGWPVAYITPPEKFHVLVRMLPELAALFRGDAKSAHADSIQIELPNGELLPSTVGKVGSDPVPIAFNSVPWYDLDDTRDNIGREVRIDLSPADAARMKLDSNVTLRATAKLPAGMPWVPVAYISRDGETAQVTLANGEVRDVEGIHAGEIFAISAGLSAGESLRLPDSPAQDAAKEATFEGVVQPGQRVEVRMARGVHARVEDLLPEGSYVKDGDWVMTLYSNTQRELQRRGRNKRKLARETYSQAAKKRDLQRLEDEQEHRDHIVNERLARVALRAQERDPAALALREDSFEQARLEYEHATQLAERLASIVGAPAELETRRRDAELVRVAMDRARLNLVRSERQADWLKQRDKEIDWENARDKLEDREATAAIARQSQEVERLQAQIELQEDLETSSYLKRFEKARTVRATAEGRLQYRQGYSLMTQRPEKIGKEFEVWSGMVIAEILDMSALTFTTELPEAWYQRLGADSPVRLRFSHLGDLELEASIEKIGRVFYVPADLKREGIGAQSVSNLKHFKVTIAFRPPAEFAKELIPGVKGTATFP